MPRRSRNPSDDDLISTFERLLHGSRGRPLVTFLEQYPAFVPLMVRLFDRRLAGDRERQVEMIRRLRHVAVTAASPAERADANWCLKLTGFDDASLRTEGADDIAANVIH